MKRDYEIRQAVAADLPQVEAIDRESFESLHSPLHVLRQYFDVFSGLFFVACGRGIERCCGYTIAAVSSDGLGWILSLAVTPKWRGRGVGRDLTKVAIARLREFPVNHIRLTVDPRDSAAVSLYASLGFTKIAEEANYYGNGEARSVMEAKLFLGDGRAT